MTGNHQIWLEVDGGLTPDTAPLCTEAGADALVAGSAVFKSRAPAAYCANITPIRAACA